MTEAVLNKCENGCEVEIDYSKLVADDRLWAFSRVSLFVEAVEADEDLKLLGTVVEDEEELFILSDKRYEDVQILIPVGAILEKCITQKRAEQICRYLKGEKRYGTNVCDAVTRIVGFYVHIREWNRSKKAELVDRIKGNYRVDGSFRPESDMKTSLNYVEKCPR